MLRLVPLRDLAAGGRQLKTLLLSIHLSTPPLLFSFTRNSSVPFRAACCTFSAICGLSAFDSLDHNFPPHSIGLSVVTHTVISYIFLSVVGNLASSACRRRPTIDYNYQYLGSPRSK